MTWVPETGNDDDDNNLPAREADAGNGTVLVPVFLLDHNVRLSNHSDVDRIPKADGSKLWLMKPDDRMMRKSKIVGRGQIRQKRLATDFTASAGCNFSVVPDDFPD